MRMRKTKGNVQISLTMQMEESDGRRWAFRRKRK